MTGRGKKSQSDSDSCELTFVSSSKGDRMELILKERL
jgi:hypothetical protein